MMHEFPDKKGDSFYRVKVEATAFKFVLPKGPFRPPPPKNRLSNPFSRGNKGV